MWRLLSALSSTSNHTDAQILAAMAFLDSVRPVEPAEAPAKSESKGVISKLMDVFSEKSNGDELIATMANGAAYIPK
jgi:hypothetical protein